MIQIQNATKKYGNQTVLDNICISFPKGKTYGIIGRNGSGKTVLLKCICGLVPLTSGSICINGKVIGKEIDVIPNAGVIIEEPGFLPSFSGLTNLKLLASLKGNIDLSTIKKTMELVGLDPSEKKHVCHYSMGMRQRLGIAQAIMENPQILVLDEPMNGLDDKGVQEMRLVFQQLKMNGTTILMATHNYEDISLLCDSVFKIKNGKLLCLSKGEVKYNRS